MNPKSEISAFPRLGRPSLVLAPMEGVTDAPMRAVQTESGAFSYCVSEFLRVTHEVPPDHVFLKHVPELGRVGCTTPSGTPVQVQLLGGDPDRLAETAQSACRLGAQAVDLNFGCPAKTVNRHDGGAVLLKSPDRIEKIVRAVREALPPRIPVSAKLRLGWEDPRDILHNAVAAAAGGAHWLTVHARTRMQGYSPPVNWQLVGKVRELVSIPVVVNGDIRGIDDLQRCREVSGCAHFMVGRGAIADPSLPARFAQELGVLGARPIASFREPTDWASIVQRFVEMGALDTLRTPRRNLFRLKQWLGMAHRFGVISWFDDIKRLGELDELLTYLNRGTVQTLP